jgi:hypothetical protein
MLTSALRVITVLAGAWNAHLCSTSDGMLTSALRVRGMECSPLLYESLLSQLEHGMPTSALRVMECSPLVNESVLS